MKTEVLWYGSATNLSELSPSSMLIPIGPNTLHPTKYAEGCVKSGRLFSFIYHMVNTKLADNQVRDLGVYFDAELNMKAPNRREAPWCSLLLSTAFRALRDLLGQEVTVRLVSAFVLSRLDYCNAILTGRPASTLAPLQRVMHAAARLVCDLKPLDHTSASIRALHWLPIKQRIDFKLCLILCIRP